MRRSRLAPLALVAALSGCNMVVSERPWFTPAQAQASPQQRPGLWVSVRDAECAFDPAGPIEDWPECAQPIMISDSDYRDPHWSDEGEEEDGNAESGRHRIVRWERMPHLLVGGQPFVDQIAWSERDSAEGPAPKARPPVYLYLALRPTAFDGQGRITAARRWPVLCGPLAGSDGRSETTVGVVTARPFPGLKISGSACTALDETALRRAAARSEAILPGSGFDPIDSHWVRDAP